MEMEEMILLKEITIFDLNKIIPGTKVKVTWYKGSEMEYTHQGEVIINNGEKFYYNYVDKEGYVGHCHVNALDLKNYPDSLIVEIKSK
ncbi:hypothetical protein J5TS4_10540 [Bacillus sp. J5TS4]|uniref:Uncharacterized protein n=2 Tax=Bacilli TaxID=91061 RepID=A0ABD3ZUV5_BACIU|nr:SPBc2 prophage-derived uncharacterized protein yoqG [Bacillus amyloliquefaciens LL3]KIL32058.1 hypothetical protein B4067_2331 [Bacillus subtilis subsp. subtilis]KIN27564.1 hypothetical protein B4069_2116 [Bacillus subtilis]QMV49026.1 hypothetical protein Goe12_c00990 [Bacillus phage vB_BsuS-Goe12]WIT28249.1 hypothetical protein [Bacillus phage SPbetaL8]GIN80476.1 hypothetical protein J5TS4_10540 [Bacillus sp. J5TS4]